MEKMLKKWRFKNFTDEHARYAREISRRIEEKKELSDAYGLCEGLDCDNCMFSMYNNVNREQCGDDKSPMPYFFKTPMIQIKEVVDRLMIDFGLAGYWMVK